MATKSDTVARKPPPTPHEIRYKEARDQAQVRTEKRYVRQQTRTYRAARGAQRAYRGTRGAYRSGLSMSRSLTGGDGVLTAEFLLCLAIVAIRVVGDYEVNDNGAQKGTLNTPANGGWGPLTVLAGLIGTFFVLGFLGSGSPSRAKIAAAAGALVTVMLIINSDTEINTVAGFVSISPGTRTVAAASWGAGSSQPWGAAGTPNNTSYPFNTGALPSVLTTSAGGSTPAIPSTPATPTPTPGASATPASNALGAAGRAASAGATEAQKKGVAGIPGSLGDLGKAIVDTGTSIGDNVSSDFGSAIDSLRDDFGF